MSIKIVSAAVAGLSLCVSLGAAAPAPSAPAAVQQYYPGPGIHCFAPGQCFPIAYRHDVYSDSSMTEWIGGGEDTCSQSGEFVWVNSPSLPAGYHVMTPSFVCTPLGPWLPESW